jgi:hypothetical protein
MGDSPSGKKKTTPKAAEPAPAPTPGPTVQPFMPGMDNMLAQQLAAGGYGNVGDLLSYFQNIYSPMTMPGSNTAPSTNTPSTGSGSGSSQQLLPGQIRIRDDFIWDTIGGRPGGRA